MASLDGDNKARLLNVSINMAVSRQKHSSDRSRPVSPAELDPCHLIDARISVRNIHTVIGFSSHAVLFLSMLSCSLLLRALATDFTNRRHAGRTHDTATNTDMSARQDNPLLFTKPARVMHNGEGFTKERLVLLDWTFFFSLDIRRCVFTRNMKRAPWGQSNILTLSSNTRNYLIT